MACSGTALLFLLYQEWLLLSFVYITVQLAIVITEHTRINMPANITTMKPNFKNYIRHCKLWKTVSIASQAGKDTNPFYLQLKLSIIRKTAVLNQ
jgi:hypothetical protein